MTVSALGLGEVHLWHLDLEEFPDQPDIDDCLGWLDGAELSRYRRLQLARHRRRYLLGRALIRTTLSRYADRSPRQWRLEQGARGKPQLADPARQAGGAGPLFFNLSHSGRGMVLAVCRHEEVGVDIETCTRARRVAAIARRYFSETETRELLALPAVEQQVRFYALWTLKEAYIKARGLGLALPLQAFSFGLQEEEGEAPGAIDLAFESAIGDDSRRWQLWQFPQRNGLQTALAVAASEGTLKEGETLALQHWRVHSLTAAEPLELQPIRVKPARPSA